MTGRSRFAALAALILALLGACAGEPAAPTASGAAALAPQPAAFRLTVGGASGAVLGEDGTGRLELLREGAGEPLGLAFANGVLAVHDLPPGRYTVARLGPIRCRVLGFEVGPESRARFLGAFRAEIVETEYFVAMMTRERTGGEVHALLAGRTGGEPGAIDARPIELRERAPCFLGKGGEGTTWAELPLGEKILIGIGFAGFCAIALASGGFCAF